MGYSRDLRERAVDAYERRAGSYDEVAALFGVGRATINRWLRLKRETGGIAERPHGGGRQAKIVGNALEKLRAMVLAKNDSTRKELAQGLLEKSKVAVSVATIGRTLRRLGLTRKKSRSMPRRGIRIASYGSVGTTASSSRESTPSG